MTTTDRNAGPDAGSNIGPDAGLAGCRAAPRRDGPTARNVLIVGAGPVGLAAAVEFRRRGFVPRIVDKGEGPTPEGQSRALAIMPTTLDVFEASGLTARLLEAGVRIERFEIARDGKRLMTLRTRPARTKHPFILALPQGGTERLMIDWLEREGVAVEWNTALVAIADTHAPHVTLSTGETARFHIVLGADGSHSAVREEIGIPLAGESYPTEFALADVVFAKPIDPATARADLRSKGGAVAMIPFAADRARYVGIAPSTEALLAGIGNIADIVWASRFTVAFRRAERMAKGRVFLAGDAAHVHSPVGGRGMNLGIWDAATLAYLASFGRESEYETKRLTAVKQVLDTTRASTDFVSAPPAAALWAIKLLGPLATSLPLVSRRIAERLLALDMKPLPWLAGGSENRPNAAAGEAGGDNADPDERPATSGKGTTSIG